MGTTNRAGALYMATGIDNTGLYKGKREAMGLIKAMAGEVTSFDVFGGIGVSAAVAFAKAAKDAYTFEKDFQKSMYEVASISGTIKGSLTDYMNSLIEMTRQIPVAANDSAKALYQIVSAGHDGADAMKILEVSAKAAVGGVTDTATAADAITTVLNAYKMSASEAGKVSDMLFMTAKLGKTTMGELGQTIAQAAPIAASYGVGIEQVLSAVASLTKQGTPTAQAMTQIRASILGVSKVLGDGAYDGRTYQEALAEVAARANGSESELRKLVPEIEAVNAVLGMTGNNANAAASDLVELQNSLGASEAAFKTMREDADNQMKLLQNNITATLRPLGEGILKEVAGVAEEMNDAFNNGDMENSLQTMETLIKLVSVAFVGYKVATLDVLKTTNAEAAATKLMATIKSSYHKVIGDGIIQKETERLSQEAYIASLESSITAEQRATLEKQNLKKGSKEYAAALSDIAVNAKNSADQEVESLTKSLAKNREKLSSVKERVEMSKAATEAAKEELNAALQSNDISATEVAQSKVISAAKREESATNDMNTVSRKINNQEKRLGIAQTRADSASTVLNSATTAGNAAATTVSSRAHNFLAAAKLKATIATRTLTAALLANPLGAFLTVVSLAATAIMMFGKNTSDAASIQERFNKSLEDQKRQLDDLKSKTEELTGVIQSETSTQYDKEKALDSLQKMTPTIFKNMDIEKLKLMDILSLNKQIAEEINRRERIGAQTKLVMATNKYSKAAADYKKKTDAGLVATNALSDKNEAFIELELAQKQVDKILNIQKKAKESLKPKELKIVSLQSNIDTLKAEISEMQELVAKEMKESGGWSPNSALLDAKKGILSNKEKELKVLDPIKPKIVSTVTPLTEDQKREAEKRKSTMEDIAKTVLGVELKLQQDRVALMADGREKALAEIETDKKARLQAIDESEKDLKKKYASTGQSMPQNVTNNYTQQRETVNTDAGYKTEVVNKDYDHQEIEFQKELTSVYLTEEEKRKQAIQDRYDGLRRAQKDAFDNDMRNIEQSKMSEKEAADAKEKALFKYNAVSAGIDKAQTIDETRGLLYEYQDYTDKRLAIEEKFNTDIATLQEARKKYEQAGDTVKVGQTDRAIAQATKDKGQGLMQLDYDKLKESPEYVRAFENLKQSSSETLSSLLSQLENAKHTAAQVLSPDQLREYTTTIQEIMDELDSRNPFGALADRKKELAEAEEELAKAQQQLNAVQGGAQIVTGVKNTKFNKDTGKIESEKTYLTATKAMEKYNKAQDNVAKKGAQVEKAEKEVKDVMDDLFNSIKDVGDAIGGPAGEIIGLIGDIGLFTITAMNGVTTASETASKSIQAVEKASVILAIIGAAIQIAMKIASLFKDDDGVAAYEKAKDVYESYIDILDRVIEKQKELFELNSKTGEQAYEKAKETVKLQEEASRELGKQYLNSGASKGFLGIGSSASKGVDQRDDLSWKAKEDARKALGQSGYDKVMDGRMTGLFDLSAKQLADLQEKAPLFWAELHGDTRTYLEQIIACSDELNQIEEDRKEGLTKIDFESFSNGFLDTLSDMDANSEDFANSFEDYLKKAILSSLITNEYKTKIQALYDNWASYTKSGDELTKEEAEALRKEQQAISDEMLRKREELAKTFGWETEDSSREASKKGIATASQDSVDENNGRLAVMQDHTYNINENLKEIANFGRVIMSDCSHLPRLEDIGNNLRTLTESQDIAIGHLSNIEKNTARLEAIESTMATMSRGIDTLNTKGITLKR